MHYSITTKKINTELIWDGNLEQVLSNWKQQYHKVIVVYDDKLGIVQQVQMQHYLYLSLSVSEGIKVWQTCQLIVDFLLENKVDKHDLIVGVGGGVITDLIGFVASIYKRGLPFAFFPTTILAMVDASIGGKNGINFENYKNVIGVINQPMAIVYDFTLLQTLPHQEWVNGFAEIIKHACIKNITIWQLLQANTLAKFKNNSALLHELMQLNVGTKVGIVKEDIDEKGIRKILNFGHTLGHAIEINHALPHGFAVAIGMHFAAFIAEKNFNFDKKSELLAIIRKYELPIFVDFDTDEILRLIANDKKLKEDAVQFVLVKEMGDAIIENIKLAELKLLLDEFKSANIGTN